MHQEARHARDRHHVAVILGRHVRHEFLDEQEVRDGVHFKDASYLGFGRGEDGFAVADAGVVD